MSTPKLPYEPGTRYSDSLTYDVATTEVVHGWQVFEQVRPDGTPTGRKSFVNHRGALCGICVAEMMRKSASEAALPNVLKALEAIEALGLHLLHHGQAVVGVGSPTTVAAATIAATATRALNEALGVRS